MQHCVFAHLSVGSSFHLLAIVNIAAVNMSVQTSVQVCGFSFLECILSSVIAVLYAKCHV